MQRRDDIFGGRNSTAVLQIGKLASAIHSVFEINFDRLLEGVGSIQSRCNGNQGIFNALNLARNRHTAYGSITQPGCLLHGVVRDGSNLSEK